MEIKEWLLENNFIITSEEYKPYGDYYTAHKKYNPKARYMKYCKLEITISNIKSRENVHVSLKENHFRGNVHGYVDKIEDILPVIEFMSKE